MRKNFGTIDDNFLENCLPFMCSSYDSTFVREIFNGIYEAIVSNGKKVYTSERKLQKAHKSNFVDLSKEVSEQIVLVGEDRRRGVFVIYTNINNEPEGEKDTVEKLMEDYNERANAINMKCRQYINLNNYLLVNLKYDLFETMVRRFFPNAHIFIIENNSGKISYHRT